MMPHPFALEIEAIYKQDDAMRLVARERRSRALTPAPAGAERPATGIGPLTTTWAARDGLVAGAAWLRAVGGIGAARRRPVV